MVNTILRLIFTVMYIINEPVYKINSGILYLKGDKKNSKF